MSDISHIAGSTIDIEVGGRLLKFSPITMGDLADFEAWIRSNKLKDAMSAMGESITQSDKIALIKAMQTGISDIDVMSELSSIRGIIHILWLSLRRNQDITVDEVGRLFNVKSIGEMQAIVDQLAFTGEVSDDSKNETI